ncbi:MAG: hypothetical protein ACXAEN_15810 [Candidatus Thorarchaeota archaeon]|jgi:hypothetical protein
MSRSRTPRDSILQPLVDRLVHFAYPELREFEISVGLKAISAYAQIEWSSAHSSMRIVCDKDVQRWHESQKVGLLAHELSHPCTDGRSTREEDVDFDVVKRGLGAYLAIERISAGKHEDHWLRRRKDRYLGYRTIRSMLEGHELSQLDLLLKEVRLAPALGSTGRGTIPHDISIVDRSGQTHIQLDGIDFILDEMVAEGEFKLLIRDETAYLYVNDAVVAESSLSEELL